jgi:hypothetical protein
MKKLLSPFIFFVIFSITANAQTEIGVEYQHGFGQSYNSNSFGSLYEGFSNSGKSSWQIGASYNFASNSSKTSGFGLSVGYRYGYAFGSSGNLFTGARLSFTFYKDEKGNGFTQFTPSLEGGYHYTFNNFGKGGFFNPSIAYGHNINLGPKETTPEDGEGNLFIIRMGAGYRF